MLKVKQKKLFLAVSIACLTVFLLGLKEVARAELAPGSVKLDKDFNQKITDYILTQPVVAGPFTGGKQEDLEEILPFFTKPLSKYNIFLGQTEQKQDFNSGETVNLNGKISFNLDNKESQKAIAELKNCNGCPSNSVYRFPHMSNVGIFVQVWRKDSDKNSAQKGDFLLDEFYGVENMNLTENEEENFSIKWKIPEGTKSGDYYVFVFANSNKRFNLAGSPLVAFFQASVFDFKVSNDEAGSGIELDKDNININGLSYFYRQPAPEIEPKDGKISISLPLTNLSPESQNIRITYNLYAWGQEDPSDLIDTKQENKSLEGGEKGDLEYSFTPSETGSVYNLQIKATTPDSVSTSNVRFLVKGINRGMFRFLGEAFDSNNKAFPVFCIRNAAWETLFSGKIKIIGLDSKGNTLGTFEEEGAMRPEDRCFTIKNKAFTDNISKLAGLKGEIYDQNGKIVDKKTVNLFDRTKKASVSSLDNISDQLTSIPGKWQILLGFLFVIVLIGAFLIYSKKGNGLNNDLK